MIQGETTIFRISKNVLRHRIYSVAFDYFTSVHVYVRVPLPSFSLAPQTPTQPLAQLKNDVKQLVSFWHALYADGKYIKKEAFVGNGSSLSVLQLATQFDLDLDLNLSNLQQALASQYGDAKGTQTWHGATAGAAPNYANTITMVAANTTRTGSATRLSTNTRPSEQANREIDRQIRNCLRRRQLLLLLVVRSSCACK